MKQYPVFTLSIPDNFLRLVEKLHYLFIKIKYLVGILIRLGFILNILRSGRPLSIILCGGFNNFATKLLYFHHILFYCITIHQASFLEYVLYERLVPTTQTKRNTNYKSLLLSWIANLRNRPKFIILTKHPSLITFTSHVSLFRSSFVFRCPGL